jgi:hypothetical protein
VRFADFERLVAAMAARVPPEFLDGIEAIEVTRKAFPHPLREGVYTLGECVPRAFGEGDDGARLRSAVQLHHGSFAALARISPGFDWEREAWETLTHELRHHLEWRARVPALERLDDAAEADYARLEGEPFPPLFHLDGEVVAPGLFKVEDDLFYDVVLGAREWRRAGSREWDLTWHGRRWQVTLPAELPDILFLTLLGLAPEPAGDVVLVLRRRPGVRDLWHRAVMRQAEAAATAMPAPAP